MIKSVKPFAFALASIGVLVAAAGTATLAEARTSRADHCATQRADGHARHGSDDCRGEHKQAARTRAGDSFARGMQAVPTDAGPGESAHGWRYFSDPEAGRAVVISPQGEYYYSSGKGLQLVAVTGS